MKHPARAAMVSAAGALMEFRAPAIALEALARSSVSLLPEILWPMPAKSIATGYAMPGTQLASMVTAWRAWMGALPAMGMTTFGGMRVGMGGG